jgi:phosphonoacetaldehyde hydrolase
MSAQAAKERAQPIPAAIEVIEHLRAQGLRVGSTTGYTRAIMDGVIAQANQHGLVTDNLVCADDLPEGRPGPLGMYRCFIDLRVWPAHTVVKVDDTVPGLMEGRHAGCWTVAVAASGNAMGLDEQEWAGLSAGSRQALLQKAHLTLEEAQPDFIVDTVADLPRVVDEINRLLSLGQLPRPLPFHGAARIPV